MGSPAVRDFFAREALAVPGASPESRLGFVYSTERIVALLLIPALLPIGLIVAVVIFLLSRRSPLVRHLRVGWEGRPLPMLKFRTMWEPAGAWRPGLVEDVANVVPASKLEPDPRVTSRFAALCRRFSIDELPQLIHVAAGQMSFVGPRPITRTELDRYYGDVASAVVLSVRPGMAGLWQVMGRDRLTYSQRRRLDVWFVRRHSVGLYFRILARSIPAVVAG